MTGVLGSCIYYSFPIKVITKKASQLAKTQCDVFKFLNMKHSNICIHIRGIKKIIFCANLLNQKMLVYFPDWQQLKNSSSFIPATSQLTTFFSKVPNALNYRQSLALWSLRRVQTHRFSACRVTSVMGCASALKQKVFLNLTKPWLRPEKTKT